MNEYIETNEAQTERKKRAAERQRAEYDRPRNELIRRCASAALTWWIVKVAASCGHRRCNRDYIINFRSWGRKSTK